MRKRWVFGLCLAVAIFSWAVFRPWVGGIRVTVANTGLAVMKDVKVFITGTSYTAGEIAPGGSRSVCISPGADSHIEIGFTDSNSRAQRLNVDCYFSSGFTGSIKVLVKDGEIELVEDNTKIGY
jgi:hypothetical protein